MRLIACQTIFWLKKKRIIRALMIIKLTSIFFLALSICASAKGFPRNVSISKKNVSLDEVFRDIKKQTGYTFVYNEALLDKAKKVSLLINDASIQRVLDECFKDQKLTYTIVNKMVVIKEKEEVQQKEEVYNSPPPPPTDISGKVTNEKGEPLQGVSVVIEGTKIGTTTNSEGLFVMSVSNNKNIVLDISNVGFQAQSVKVGDQTKVAITLKENVAGLTDVVVVGYGTQKKATVSGSVVSIKGEELDIAPVVNATNALAGRLAGVTTMQRSGEPGADAASIRIRGVNTLGNNDPLVVVDGVPGRSLERIDPSTVESISVLKDASAAIYGSSAANGVILITTKRGKTGKPQVIIDFNQGFNQPTRIPQMANASEYATMLNETDIYRRLAPRYTTTEIQKFSDGSDP